VMPVGVRLIISTIAKKISFDGFFGPVVSSVTIMTTMNTF
jgi:hypothetical protein